jgi:hypothetical protein
VRRQPAKLEARAERAMVRIAELATPLGALTGTVVPSRLARAQEPWPGASCYALTFGR